MARVEAKEMKYAILLLPLATACGSTPSTPSRSGPLTTEEILVASKPSIDPAQLKAGQWVLLSVSAAGDPKRQTTKIQVTAGDASGFWIEQKVPATPRPVVFKTKIARDGTLLEGWVGE